MSRNLATALGFVAIVLWSLLALLTVLTTPVPPFLLTALTFGLAGIACLVWTVISGRLAALKQVPLGVVLFGTAGLFGYHALYYTALRMAPPAEATLVNYLWPLLVVLLSGLMLGERLRLGHAIGALIGFSGAALVIWGNGAGLGALGTGHFLALTAAFVWAIYSVLSRRIGHMPTEAVVLYCLATALLSGLVHVLTETTVWPEASIGWLAIIALGIGPVGMAVFVWDIGMKQGDIRLLGAASYAAPVMSTLLLVLAGWAEANLTLALAVFLIICGAVLAVRASRKDPATKSPKRAPAA